MKNLFPICLALALLPLTGCITGEVIQAARSGRHSREVVDAKTGETNAVPAYPWANYFLLPLSVPADIAVSPITVLGIIIYIAAGGGC